MSYEAILPGEKGSTVTSIFSCTTGFGVSLPIRLNSIDLGALVTLPLLLSMLSAKVLLDPREIPECPGGVMVDARGLGAHIDPLSDFSA